MKEPLKTISWSAGERCVSAQVNVQRANVNLGHPALGVGLGGSIDTCGAHFGDQPFVGRGTPRKVVKVLLVAADSAVADRAQPMVSLSPTFPGCNRRVPPGVRIALCPPGHR